MRINFSNGYKDVIPNDESYRLRAIMSANEINLKFSLSDFFEFPLGSYVKYQGQRYTLNSPAIINEVNSTHFDYSMTLGSPQDLLRNFKIKDTQGRLKFPITAKPSEHLELLVYNLNQNDGGWSVGECIDKYEKLIPYNHTNCYDALQTIADKFKTEFEIVGKTIHLRKVKYNEDNPLPLSYGMGNGFVSGVGRNNDDQKAGFNVLYVQGGNRNIDFSKYGNKELLLPKNQQYIYEGVTYQTDDKGLCISVVGDSSVTENRKEESLDLTHIYPKRVGEISEVVAVDEDNHFYNFKDASIPDNLNYNDCLIKGNKEFTISFQSGMLSGREFGATYDHSKREFKLVPKEEDGYTMPSGVYVPKIGDKYTVFSMQMPNAYICDNSSKSGASWEMFKEACKHFYENHESKFTFKGTLDGIWAKKDWLNIGGRLKLGGFISFSDEKFQPDGINIRIISVKDFLNNSHSPEIELANSVQGGSIATELDKIKENEVVGEDLHKKSIDYTKRRFRDAEETARMLINSKLNFGKGINPMSVNAMQLLAGDKSLQFQFIDSISNPIKVEHSFIYDQDRKVLKTSGGILQHLTLGIDAVKPNQIYKTWNVTPFESPALTDKDKSYYFYVKASKHSQNASFVLSENAIGLEEVSGYYYLLTGLLNLEIEGERSFVKMYGFTEILPGQIKVEKWSSGNGQQFVEFLHDRIRINGDVSFTNDSPAFAQIAGVQDLKIGSAEQRAKDYANAQVDAIEIESRNLLPKANVKFDSKYKFFSISHTNGKLKGAISAGGSFYFDNNKSDNIVRFTMFFTTTEDNYSNGDRKYVIYHYFRNLKGGKWHHLFKSANYQVEKKHTKIRGWFCDSINGDYPNEVKNLHINYSNKDLGYTMPFEDIQAIVSQSKQEAIQANQAYISAQNFVTQVTHSADLDDVRTEAEQNAISEATAKMNLAKAYAVAKDTEKEILLKAYADGKISQVEQSAINIAQAKANLAEQRAKAHADNIVTAEEQRAITDAKAKLNEAKAHAQALSDEIKIGGRNLFKTYDIKDKFPTSDAIFKILSGDVVRIGNINISESGNYIFSAYIKKTKRSAGIRVFDKTTGKSLVYVGINEDTDGEFKRIKETIYLDKGQRIGMNFYGHRWSAGSEDAFVKKIQIEKGTKATDWTPATEDVQASIDEIKQEIEPTKQIADYLAKSLKENTEVNGGLVLASTIGAKNGNDVKSYMSGLNAIAFAAGVRNFGTQNETQNVAIRHDGTAKVGVFDIDGGGNVRILDNNNDERIGFHRSNITPLNEILSDSVFSNSAEATGTTSVGGGYLDGFNNVSAQVAGLSMTIPKNGGVLTVSGKLSVLASSYPNQDVSSYPNGMFLRRYVVSLVLCKNDNDYTTIYSEIGIIGKNLDWNNEISINKRINISSSGNYSLKLKYSFDSVDDSVSNLFSYNESFNFSEGKFDWDFKTAQFKKTVFGANGFLSAFPDILFYLSKENGLVVKGNVGQVNMPGVLCTATANIYGTQSNYWGICDEGGVERIGQGYYRISHNIGHSEYTATFTVHHRDNGARYIHIGTRTSYYIDVYFYRDGNLKDTGFDYVLYGKNFR